MKTLKKTYKFICGECGKLYDRELKHCEKCGEQTIRKMTKNDYITINNEHMKEEEENRKEWRERKKAELANVSEKEKRYCKKCKIDVKFLLEGDSLGKKIAYAALLPGPKIYVKRKICPYCGTNLRWSEFRERED